MTNSAKKQALEMALNKLDRIEEFVRKGNTDDAFKLLRLVSKCGYCQVYARPVVTISTDILAVKPSQDECRDCPLARLPEKYYDEGEAHRYDLGCLYLKQYIRLDKALNNLDCFAFDTEKWGKEYMKVHKECLTAVRAAKQFLKIIVPKELNKLEETK